MSQRKARLARLEERRRQLANPIVLTLKPFADPAAKDVTVRPGTTEIAAPSATQRRTEGHRGHCWNCGARLDAGDRA